MKYFKDNQNNIYSCKDSEVDKFTQIHKNKELFEITKTNALSIVNPEPTPENSVTLEKLRFEALKKIEKDKKVSNIDSFEFRAKVIKADMPSIIRMQNAVLNAYKKGQSYTVSWDCADESVLELDYDGILEMQEAFADYEQKIYIEASKQKEKINVSNKTTVKSFLSKSPSWIKDMANSK